MSRPKVTGAVKIGDLVTIRCEIRADPPPDIIWKIGNSDIIKSDANYKIEAVDKEDFITEYSITIQSVQKRDNGKAQIAAKNILAEVTCPFSIIVEDQPGNNLKIKLISNRFYQPVLLII